MLGEGQGEKLYCIIAGSAVYTNTVQLRIGGKKWYVCRDVALLRLYEDLGLN
jgi:hypothetical protein